MLLDLSQRDGSRDFESDQDESCDTLGGALAENGWYPACKAVVEFAIALGLLVLASPLIGVAAVLTTLTSRGPMIHSQVRLGRYGIPYTIYKIRTMVHRCEQQTGPCWSTAGDPRITRWGWFLRITHLDELPQLWNVLRGEMSLVGPRPERPEFTPHLERVLPLYRERLRVRPGMTGLAQVQLPADTDVRSVRRKLAYDLYYVQHMNFWLDVRIILCTALKVLGVPFTVLRALFRMPSRITVKRHYRNLLEGRKSAPRLNRPKKALP
jgi:lipopolysaccharide/colanic/teichoic acid biosynthesis glycosyltransferase